jgi:hypothetical protein
MVQDNDILFKLETAKARLAQLRARLLPHEMNAYCYCLQQLAL